MATANATTTATANSTNVVSPQGGILEGGNPTHYDSKNPLVLFIIQAVIIIVLCRLIHWPLSKLRQPRVIAEVIGGIVLGPSVMGRIPGFTDAIFPTASIPSLNVVANLGLVLFLFLVGLETDLRFLISNWRVALSVSAAGMVLPFGLGCAISYGLYHEFHDDPGTKPIAFGTYLLFIGIAMAITAFPVLCRILTELKLLSTRVGVIVLSAGVGNDVVGWILLALCVALVNAGSGITALYVLLVCVAYMLFLTFAFRPLFLRFLEKTGSLQKGPSQSVVALTLLIALASAFFTQVIGVHAIFGGFVIGLICPHEGGFAIKITEKVEDLVAVIFLPLYFTLSGLSTNLGLLDSGIVWGYVVGVIAIAFIAKVTGGAVASRLCGLLWRESFSIGVLMSCKGLVELIVLNIGLQAKILSTRTFTIFVVMALVTTFLTTPLTTWLYPRWYQVKVERWRRGEIDWEGNPVQRDDRNDSVALAKGQLKTVPVRKLLVYLRLDGLSGVCTVAALLSPKRRASVSSRIHPAKMPKQTEQTVEDPITPEEEENTTLKVHGVRLMELTDRDSSVMKVAAAGEHALWDPVVNTFRAFGDWHDLSLMAGVSVVPEHSYADTVIGMAQQDTADMLLLPWSETGTLADHHNGLEIDDANRFSNGAYTSFVSDILERVTGHVGILIEYSPASASSKRPVISRTASGLSLQGSIFARQPTGSRSHHIVLPFFGGDDDRFALRLVMQLAHNDQVTATVIQIGGLGSDSAKTGASTAVSASTSSALPASSSQSDMVFFETLRDSVPEELQERIVFHQPGANETITDAVQLAVVSVREELNHTSNKANNIVIVGRRSISSEIELGLSEDSIGHDTRRALGAVGTAMVQPESKIYGSVLVLQAGTDTGLADYYG
ncbi:Cation/H+ exchanger [Penicillium expansum]|uniref:Cation/H+ exchanger n=1 Tax=Penicillium expansum TaxID=27334 RepID=A0A0A2K3W6_PENEN|nr:Cation/H+ exchanger [Penicillium expansum]KGO37076.1 Cation/H+ exchanger [Penicillium expansum]KGO62374.1 Cation/H+ exchanger [Penicillium expansum]